MDWFQNISLTSGYPLRNILHHSREQMFQQDHVFHQLSECETTLMKVLKQANNIIIQA